MFHNAYVPVTMGINQYLEREYSQDQSEKLQAMEILRAREIEQLGGGVN
ncbi:hypothetical protein [Simkania sp.]